MKRMGSKRTRPQARARRLQRQTADMNTQLVLTGVRQHELIETAEKLNELLQAEIIARRKTEQALLLVLARVAEHAAALETAIAERTEKLQETMGELEGFSYSIVHDLRAPLRALQGFSGMLEESYGSILDGVGKDYLRRIATSANRMDQFIQDALSYSRVLQMDLRPERVDADNLLRGIIESYPDFQEPKAQVVIEGPLYVVLANETALTQCFSNLLNNAVKFVQPDTKPRVRITAERRGHNVRFWIADEGIGIAERHFGKIFEIFQRLDNSYEGTGIGLAIVRKAVGRMGGQVGVESEPGKGSRFWLELKGANDTEISR